MSSHFFCLYLVSISSGDKGSHSNSFFFQDRNRLQQCLVKVFTSSRQSVLHCRKFLLILPITSPCVFFGVFQTIGVHFPPGDIIAEVRLDPLDPRLGVLAGHFGRLSKGYLRQAFCHLFWRTVCWTVMLHFSPK